jgi:Tfp pilus assembly protein PilN
VRPINLMPEEERHGRVGVLRTGPLPFFIVGALVALLAGVVMLALTSNQISERKDEVVRLEGEKAVATARAEQLQPYADFQQLKDRRVSTVASLADSRFDWVRTIRQLSLIIPGDVWLIKLEASAIPGGSGGGESAASGSSASVLGPSLTMDGCAAGQNSVAAFVAALKQIDGVTRVGLSQSTEDEESGEEGSESSEEGCGEHRFQFSLIVAFDDAPPSVDGGATITSEVSTTTEEAPVTEEAPE